MIEGFGPAGLQLAGLKYRPPIVIFDDIAHAWSIAGLDDVGLDGILSLLPQRPEIILLGCGARTLLPPKILREAARAQGIALEPMDTGAACRTYNILFNEGRLVAAALFA